MSAAAIRLEVDLRGIWHQKDCKIDADQRGIRTPAGKAHEKPEICYEQISFVSLESHAITTRPSGPKSWVRIKLDP